MTKTYRAWPTKTATIGPMTATVADMGTVILDVGEKYELHGDVLVVTMADAKFADLPIGWVLV